MRQRWLHVLKDWSSWGFRAMSHVIPLMLQTGCNHWVSIDINQCTTSCKPFGYGANPVEPNRLGYFLQSNVTPHAT